MNEWIEVRESGIHNKGVFAKKTIPKDTYFIEYVGEKITTLEAERRELENDKKGTTYIFILDDDYCIDGEHGGNESRFINHSCDPNCDVDIKDGKIFIFALKEIKKGEEVTYDYWFPHDDAIRNPCLCRSDVCRGFIQAPSPD